MTDAQFLQYDSYKGSEIEWLGGVPAHWEVKRLKNVSLINPNTEIPPSLSSHSEVDFLPMTNVDGKKGAISHFNTERLENVQSGYTKFQDDDVIFAKITPCMENGNCAVISGLRTRVGFGSTEFFVYRASPKLLPVFLHYFLHNEAFRRNAEPFMKGSAGQKRVTNLYMSTHLVPLPPVAEQKALVDYLDAKTAQLDREIELLTRKAELYGKLKQSLINETVTKGLDKSVAMKDSGVEWLGEVPAHWGVERVKDLFTERVEKGYPDEPLLIASQKHGVILKSDYDTKTMTAQKNFEQLKLVQKRDYVISLRSFEGGIEIAYERGIISSAYTIMNSENEHYTDFYKHLFKSRTFISMLVTCTTGIREGRNINFQQFRREMLPVPSPTESHTIADYLNNKTAQIDCVVDTIQAQIEKLQELRKTLINDVVTGKIKVV